MTQTHGPLPSHLFSSHLYEVDRLPLPGETAFAASLEVPEATPDIGSRRYTVILASGGEDGGKRATLAFSMACTALSMDLDAHLFLVGDGSIWAYEGNAQKAYMHGFPPLRELMEDFQELGGGIAVCSTCDRVMCGVTGAGASHDAQPAQRLPGIQVQGMAALLARVMEGRAVTF